MADHKYHFTPSDARDSDAFCVFLANLTYKQKPEIERELHEAGYPGTNVLFINGRLTSCFILRWDDVTAIAFKGSTNWREWLNNCNVWLEPTQFGRVHAGFLNTIKSIGPMLYRIIYPDILAGAKIVLTGHSRGGALACVFAYFLALNACTVHRVVTFGAPRFCDEELGCHLQGSTYEPKPPPPRWSLARVKYWLLHFRVVFVPVCLYLSLRTLWPFIRAHIAARLMKYNVINRFLAAYRGLQAILFRTPD